MKLYKRLKGIKKSTKLGLVGAALYASTLALPANAEVKQEKVAEPVNLESVTSIEENQMVYFDKLFEYSLDDKLNHMEIWYLYKIAEHGSSLEEKADKQNKEYLDLQRDKTIEQIVNLKYEKEYLEESVTEFIVKLKSARYRLAEINSNIKKEATHKQIFLNYEEDIKKIRKNLDNLIQTYYPGLIKGTNSDYHNLHYSANNKLVGNLENEIFPLIRKANKIFHLVFDSDEIDQFWHEDIILQDIISFREVLKLPKKAIVKYVPADYAKLKEEQIKLIESLEKKKPEFEIKANRKIQSLSSELIKLDKKSSSLTTAIFTTTDLSGAFFHSRLKSFADYLLALEKRKEFLEKYKIGMDKYWGPSLLLDLRVKFRINNDEYDFKSEVKTLENLLKSDTLGVDVEDIRNPTATKAPLWLVWVGGTVFAGLRRLFIAPCIVRRKYDLMDLIEPLAIAGFLGPYLLDGIHPFAYPLRLFAWPFVEEPIRKWAGWTEPIK